MIFYGIPKKKQKEKGPNTGSSSFYILERG